MNKESILFNHKQPRKDFALMKKTETMLTIDLMAFGVIYLTLNDNKIITLMYYNHVNSIANLLVK